MPQQYELECRYCGYRFLLDEHALAGTEKCPVCGGLLTVAIPVPVRPASPPAAFRSPIAPPDAPQSPPPPPAPSPVHPEALGRPEPSLPPVDDAPELGDLDPEVRARFLCEPWGSVYQALHSAARIAVFGFRLSAVGAALDLCICPGVPPARGGFLLLHPCLAILLLLPVLAHAYCQKICTLVSHSEGRSLVVASIVLAGSGAVALGLGSAGAGIYVGLLGFILAVFSFFLWLSFLERLGHRFRDLALTHAAWSYISWVWVGFIPVLALLVGSAVAAKDGEFAVAWCCRAAAAVICLALLHAYAALLHTAALTIARRAPLPPAAD